MAMDNGDADRSAFTSVGIGMAGEREMLRRRRLQLSRKEAREGSKWRSVLCLVEKWWRFRCARDRERDEARLDRVMRRDSESLERAPVAGSRCICTVV